MNYLYHGSVMRGLTTLEPRKRYTPDPSVEFSAIYVTPLPAFAVTHAFSWSSADGFDVHLDGDLVTLVCPVQCQSKLLVPISIYTIASGSFIKTEVEETGYTWHSMTSVAVLEEVQFTTVIEALERYNAALKIISL